MALPDDDLWFADDPALLLEELRDLLNRPAWHRDALCREPAYADVSFFPARGEPLDEARAVCARCLVQQECVDAALEGRERGVWGGLSEVQRRRLRRAQRAA